MALPFHAEQSIAAPPGVVWDFIIQFRNSGRWMRDTLAIEVIGEGQFGVGSRFRQTRRLYNRVATEEFEVTSFDEAARSFALEVDGKRGTLGRGVFRFRYRMQASGEPRGSSTLVVLDGEIDGLGFAVELIASFFVGNFVRVVEQDLDGLRRSVEEGASFEAPATGVTTSSISRAPST